MYKRRKLLFDRTFRKTIEKSVGERESLAVYFSYFFFNIESQTITEIVDGTKYSAMNVSFPESISLTCNTDGIPVFSSYNTAL